MSDTHHDNERTTPASRADQFRNDVARGPVNDWEPYFTGITSGARLDLLAELIVIDMKHRWSRGERPVVEDYVGRFPELGPIEQLPGTLIVEEYCCRLKAGESANATDYRARFPAQFPAIQAALDAAGGSWTIAEGAPQPWEPMAEGVVAVSQQYELVRELGRGTFGEVWLARKNPSGIEKAIKILKQSADRESAQRELRSLELIKNLRHPYLLATEDFWVANNRLHIVMELADGTLRARLKHHLAEGQPGIPEDELFRYIAEAAEGLDFLHAHRITHRDVKPDNILILHGHAKVADFGLARQQEQLVESMSFAGTPTYMAPEVWDGEGGPPSDLYSLAFAYTELRQGRPPLRPRPLAQLLKAHEAGQFEFADFLSDAERAVLRRALARLPEARHATCTEFVQKLAHALGRPFTGKSTQVSARRAAGEVRHSLRAMPGTDLDVATSLADSASAAAAPHGTAVTKPEGHTEPTPWVRPSRARILAEIGGITLIAAAIMFGVWFLFLNGRNTTPPTGPSNDPPQTIPAGTAPEPGAREVQLVDRTVPEWIFAEKGSEKVRFRLITGSGGSTVATFYIMESKVTNRLYSAAGKEAHLIRPAQPEPTDEQAPVMNVTAHEARDFAVKVFGGNLPSEDEWDHAAGSFDQQGQSTPTLPPGRAWVGKPVPGPVKRANAEADINRFGLLDIAGNGREWTRMVLTRAGQRKQLGAAELAATDKVILRGRNYTLERPLTFAILEKERADQPQAALPHVPSPYTGFRVVLPLP